MAVITRSGLIAATTYVASFFAANGVTAAVSVGWRERDKVLNQGSGGANRVVFIPSSLTGDAGAIAPVRFPGDRNVRATAADAPIATIRSLGSWERTVSVSVWAADRSDPTNESAQIEATETLLEWVMRAVHSAPGAFADAQFGKVLMTPLTQRSYGLELSVELSFKQPIFDVPRDLVYPTGKAVARAPYVAPVVPPSHGDT